MYVIPIDFGTPAYDETVDLRDRILRQPLNLQFTPKQLEVEFKDIHLACYNENAQLLGCLVIMEIDETTIKMRQVAVDNKLQRSGVGTAMVNACEQYGKDNNYQKIVLSARDNAIPFYEKLGYKKIGKPFTEVTIKHYKMVKKL